MSVRPRNCGPRARSGPRGIWASEEAPAAIWQVGNCDRPGGDDGCRRRRSNARSATFSHGMLQVSPEVRQPMEGAAGWCIVEAFTDLRRRQAALLSLNSSVAIAGFAGDSTHA